MFRDRLRDWRMNDKNRRSAATPRRRVLQSTNNGDKPSKPSKPASHCNMFGRRSSQLAMLDHENIHNVLQTPKEILVLQRTLKGVLDWQQHAEDSMIDLEHRWAFFELLKDMQQCLIVSHNNMSMCGKITPQLRRTSAKLQSHMATCTPLAVLRSVDELLYFASNRNFSPWYYETSRFLINAAAETFPESHPSLLLIRLLLDGLTPPQLIMVYEVGSIITNQLYDEVTTLSFRIRMHSAASYIGLGAAIRSYADALCSAAPDETNPWRLYDMAILYYSMHQYEKAADAARRYIAQIEDEGDGNSSTLIGALQFLAVVQSEQNDFVGEEITLQKILATALARDRRELHTSQLSMDALKGISCLEGFYMYYDLSEQRDALHMDYPSAFEL